MKVRNRMAMFAAALLATGGLAVAAGPAAQADGPDDGCDHVGIVIEGNAADNVLVGTPWNDVIRGFGGDDRIDGGGGNDTIYGGDGDDIIRGGDCDDTMYGGPGDDLINGESGTDSGFGGLGVNLCSPATEVQVNC
ncbi:MAG TPA: hypothetical protein VMU51_32500 [Mycobacteriales bacterium]|nr:hypothetical protein [Mycobacteriales bacterium]